MDVPGRVVLVVEDDLSVQGALERFLAIHGFSVVTAATAADALEIVREQPLIAAIIDLHLPGGSGRDVVESIPPPIPVIIFSGLPEESGALEILRPNTRLVQKPYSLVLLVEALEQMIEG